MRSKSTLATPGVKTVAFYFSYTQIDLKTYAGLSELCEKVKI